MSKVFLVISSALALAGCATPPQAPPAAVAAAPATKVAAKSGGLICKQIATTGTRFTSSDCRTQADWDAMAADARRATQDQQTTYGRPQ